MKLIAIGLLFSISIKYSLANCIVQDYTGGTINNQNAVDDTEDTLFISITVQNVVGVQVLDPSSYKYINVDYADNQLHFRPSAAFANFEDDASFLQFPTVSTQIRLTCADTSTSDWTFHQTITDTNNHQPTFNKDSYKFIVPMPFPGGLAFTEFGGNILVTDIDISNSRIDFEIEEEDGSSLLYVDYAGKNDAKGKEHIGIVRSKTPLKLTGPVTFTVKATDTGNPVQSSTATITIEIDPNGSVPASPQFEKGYYTATYDNVDDQHSISSTSIPVTEGVTEENIQLSGGYEGSFQYVVENNQLKITLKDNLPADVISSEPFVALSISASIENAETSATTSLIISMPGTIKAEFDQVFYQAEYKNDEVEHSISDVTVGVTDGAIVTLGGDFASNFEYNTGTKTISLTTNLEDNIITNRQYIDVTIKAEIGSTLTETVLIVSIPAEVKVQFDQLLYTAEYNNEETQHTIGTVNIEVTAEATITLEGEYKDYFQYSDVERTITLKDNLPDNVISLLYVDVTIKATLGSSVAEAVLIVSMPDEATVKFNKVFYQSAYNNENADHEITSVILDVTEGAAITLDGVYKDNFKYVEADKSIVLLENLPEDTINSLSYIDVTIKATIGSSTAEAILIVSMPGKANVKFNTVFYETTYNNVDGNHEIDAVVVDVSDGADVTLEGLYKDYFHYAEDTKTITLTGELPADTINSCFIAVTIKAAIGSTVAEAVMIVSMPDEVDVQFNQLFYETTYKNEGAPHEIDPVVIGVTEGATVTLEGEYKDHFDYNEDAKTITLANELLEDTITTLNYIDVTIKATIDSSVAEAIMIVSMPKKVNLKFDPVLYEAIYKNEGTVHEITEVVIGVTEGATISLEGEYKDHFDYNEVDKTITLKSELPEDVITSSYYTYITIKATMGASVAEATMIVVMPGKVNLRFDQVLYEAMYNNEGAVHEITEVVIGVTEGAAISLEGVYKDNFHYNEADNTITLVGELHEDTISTMNYIDITIKASIDSTVAEAILIVSMPGKVNVKFDQVFYEAIYKNEGAAHEITEVVIGVTEGATVSLEGVYKDHFHYNEADKTITLASELPENIISSSNYVDVTIKATIDSTVAEAILIVTMPGKVNLRFDQILYEAIYKNEGAAHEITEVVIGVTEGATISFEGEFKDNFQYNEGDKTITLKGELPENIIGSLNYIDVTIKATIDSTVAEAILIVTMPGKINLRFDQILYEAIYKNEGAAHEITEVVIGVTEGATISFEGEFKDNFHYNEADKTITLASELPENIIGSSNYVDVTIKATIDSTVAEAILIVTMPGKVNLRFDQILYEAIYKNEGAAHEITEVVIGVTEGATISIEGEFKDNFHYNEADKTITLASELPENVIGSLNYVDVTIKATIDSTVAEAILIVTMPGKVNLRFDQILYEAIYKNEGAAHEITEVVIGVTEGATISIEGEFKDNFHYNEADKTITLASELPENIIGSSNYVDVTIKATIDSTVAEAILIVTMPGKVNLRFDQILYEAIYKNEGAAHEITEVVIGVTEGATISFEGEFKDNFHYNEADKTITLASELPANVIGSLNYVDVTIKATIDSTVAEAVLIVTMPGKVNLRFDQILYEAIYKNEGAAHEITEVVIGVTEGATISIEGEFKDNFQYNEADKTITLASELPENIIGSLNYVDVTIKATIDSTVSEAILIVTMPGKVNLRFDQILYEAIYKNEGAAHEITEVVIGVTEGATISIEGEFKDNFHYNEADKTITLASELPENIIGSSNYVDVTIKATIDSTVAEAILIVTMPGKVNLRFDQILYEAIYKNEGAAHEITEVVIGVTEGATISFEGEFKDNFHYNEADKTITLASELPENVIGSLNYIDVTIKATIDSTVAEAVLIVTMPGKVNLRFDQILYEAIYKNEGAAHEVTEVVIGVTEGATISIEGEFKDNFHYNEADKTITLASELPENVIGSLNYVDVTIKATIDSTVAEAILIVTMPGKVNLRFDQILYEAIYKNEGAAHEITEVVIGVTEGATISIEGEFKDNFYYNEADKTITLANELPENVIGSSNYVDVTIKATIDSSVAEAILIVTMPGKVNLWFDQILYEATYKNEGTAHEITPVVIGVTEGAAVTLAGDQKDYFEYKDVEKTVILKENLPDSIITSSHYIDIRIIATIGSSVEEAVLIVSIPCQGTIPPSAVITFTGEYIFKKEPGEDIDEQVTAESTIDEEITYELKGNVPPKLVLSSNGHLQTVDLPPGFYDLEIVATGSSSKATATAPLKISIGSANICNDEIIVDYSFLARAIEEGQDEKPLLQKHDGYYYKVEYVEPSTDRFEVNSVGDVIVKTLDRESDEFANGRPQYIVKIRLAPETEDRYSVSSRANYIKSLFNHKYDRASNEDDQCYTVTDIKFDVTLVTVGIIVVDINDHKPEFAENEAVVGYPTKDVLTLVAPAYLLKVEATDKDTGIRASLTYALDTDKVVIDSKTGYIYPTNKIYDIDEPIAVTATDEDGEGNSSDELLITVKFLEEKHLSLLSYAGKHLGDLDDVMESLKTYADVRYLSASVLPVAINNKRDDNSNDKSLVLVAYAFDFSKQLLTASELKEILDDIDGLTIESLSNTGNESKDDDDSSDTGLIIAVSVLAVLLALCLIGFIAFYFLKVRKSKTYNKMDENGFAKDETKGSALGAPRFTKNSGPTSSTKSDVDVTTRRPTGYILELELVEEKPSSPPSTPSAPSEAMNEELRERRKSVVFNSNVEEINIEREADDQDGDKTVASNNSQSNNTQKY